MRCQNCSHENRTDALFCTKCGGRLRPTCSSCGGNVSPGQRFCDRCGEPVVGSGSVTTPSAALETSRIAHQPLSPPGESAIGSTESAELKLKAAVSLLNETSEQTSDIQGIRRARQAAINWGNGGWAGIWDEVKALSSISRQLGGVLAKLDQAIALAQEASDLDPDVETAVPKDEEFIFTPRSVTANARFQQGLLDFAQERYGDAETSFEASLDLVDNGSARLFLAYTIEAQGYRQRAVNAFERVIEIDSGSEEAVEATKELAALRSFKPKSKKVALLLSIFLGLVGVDRLYLGYILGGLLKFITFGGFYVWWVIDILRILTNNLKDSSGWRLEE